MGLNMDFGGGTEAAAGFKPLPTGNYNLQIEDIEVKDTKPKEGVEQTASDGTQAQYLNVQYKVIDDEDYNGRFVWGIQSIRFPENALDDTKKERQTREIFLGWLNTVTGTDFAGTNQELDIKNLVGAKCQARVIETDYQGDPKNEIKKIMPYESDNGNVEAVRRSL